VLQTLRQLDLALESYDTALKINTRYAEAWSNRGITLHLLNRSADAVKSYNDAIGKLNSTNEKLNEDRSKNIEGWNKSVDSFLDKQVPKD
jgi:tetratricopeptide (TPR) repeat protein